MRSVSRSVLHCVLACARAAEAPCLNFLKLSVLASFIFSLTAFAVPVPAVAAESIAISCYRNNEYVGNVNVLRVKGAANACNQVYASCEEQCSACFIDFDYVAEVCVDIYGRTYLR